MRRARIEHDDEQCRAPQAERSPAGLGHAGQTAGGDQPRIFEQLEPARLLGRRHGGGKLDLLGIDHQCPGERFPGFLHAAHAEQPARRFRDPEADHEHQHERRQPDQEEAAPADDR